MSHHVIKIIMNGVTGRMGRNQHLIRSILAIRQQGGIRIGDNETIYPEPVLVGRNEKKLAELAELGGGLSYTTDFYGALSDPENIVYFDAQSTDRRFDAVRDAIKSGKHVYCEKPVAATFAEAIELYRLAKEKGVKTGVVQDKLWLPGIRKLKYLIDTGFLGRVLSVRGEFGYWVFSGENQPAQRPSWNYKKELGGGIILDMLCHWRYLIDNLIGNIISVFCFAAVHIPDRWDENGNPYKATAEDAAYAMFLTENQVVCQFNSSWCTRVRRDDLLTIQVDGTHGSAVAGLRECWIQPDAATPRPVWNPDVSDSICFFDQWQQIPTNFSYDNAFKIQWELFLRHVVKDEPFRWDLKEGAKGVQLAELAYKSWQQRCWIDVPSF